MDFLQKYRKALIAGGSIIGLLVIVLGAWFFYNQAKINVTKDGRGQEYTLVQQDNTVAADLSNCLDKSARTAQITQQEMDSVSHVLSTIVQARYVDSSGNPTRASGVLGGGSFISSLAESYPAVSQADWHTLINVVDGCRDDFTQEQVHLQILAKDFRTWTQGGSAMFTHGWRSQFPDSQLKVTDPVTGEVKTGDDALQSLLTVITTQNAAEALHTHRMPDQNLFPSGSASAPASPVPSSTASH